MRHIILIYMVCLIGFCSCRNASNNNRSAEPIQDFEFEMISSEIKDSLLYLTQSGLITFSISTKAAIEPEDNNTLEWILQNGKSKDFEELLYNHPKAQLKAIGVKGLIRTKDKNLFKHIKYAFEQDINLQYGLYCQKLGGYFLYQLNYGDSDSLKKYLPEEEIEKLNKLVDARNFGCT